MNEKKDKDDSHGKTQEFNIVINAQPFKVDGPDISYQQVFDLANDGSWDANTSVLITYTRGHGNKPEGTLAKGGSVKLKDDMIFDVDPTGKS
jgi:hypothetical protein